MQRTENGMVIISCDFTGNEWDEQIPMMEGHEGSVICLEALAMAVDQASPATQPIKCTMCLQTVEPPARLWQHSSPPATANQQAAICWDCIQQADRTFASDPDTQWQRRIAPDDRWR